MTEKNESEILRLRAHHITAFAGSEIDISTYYLSDQEYLRYIKEHFLGGNYPDEFLLQWREILKDLHENPDKKFRYVSGSDSVCERCVGNENCNKPGEHYEFVQQFDKESAKLIPELKVGEVYCGNDIIQLLIEKGLLEK